MTASGTVRTATERRLIDKIALLPGFDTSPSSNAVWWVTSPITGQAQNDRLVVIGTYVGEFIPEGMAAGANPQMDEWTIECGIGLLGFDDTLEAKQEAEDAYNMIADMIAADARLSLAGEDDVGVQQVTTARMDGPTASFDDNGTPLVFIEFAVSAAAVIHRN